MAHDLQHMIDEVRAGFATALRVRGKTLAVQVRKAGRHLPRAIRRDATYLAQIAGMADNPKLARMVDQSKAQRAHADVLAYLSTIDPALRRRTAILDIMTSVVLVLLVTAVLLLFVLVQRGLI